MTPFDPTATQADILACFRLILGRDPNPEERQGHLQRAGEPLAAVVSSYVNSLEFARRRLQDPTANAAPPQIAEHEGVRLYADPNDLAVGKAVLAGTYEPEVAAVFRATLRPGMRALDIGANIGVFTMLAASLVGPAGHVLAMEPNPRNARLAEASRRLNGFEHVTVLQAAAGRAPGLLALNTSFSNGTTSTPDTDALPAAETVACLPIDALALPGPRVHLVKIDVEGAEYNALLGAERLIRRDHPLIVFEFGPGQLPGISGVSGETLLQWLTARGYTLEVIQHDAPPTPHGQDCTAVLAAYQARNVDHIDVIARPPHPWRPNSWLPRLLRTPRSWLRG